MFEEIGRKLSGMVSIPTVSGKGNEKEYHIKEYREYLEKEFPDVFCKAHMIGVGEARLLRFAGKDRGGACITIMRLQTLMQCGMRQCATGVFWESCEKWHNYFKNHGGIYEIS